MKITIEAETKEEKQQMSERLIFHQVFQFGIIGHYESETGMRSFSHLHTLDKFVLYGQLTELRERLKDAGSQSPD